MSGHSKWTQIKRQKGVQDSKRGAVFTKLASAITVATRQGGGDPEANFKLRVAIDKARAVNMPKDNIERAINRGTGAGGDGNQLEEVLYEGYGPGRVAVVIKTITDNKNRTSSNLRHLLEKYGGSLGKTGTVLWQFEKRGVIRVPLNGRSAEDLEMLLIDLGAQDLIEEDGGLTVLTAPKDLQQIKEGLDKKGLEVELAEEDLRAGNLIETNTDEKNKLQASTSD